MIKLFLSILGLAVAIFFHNDIFIAGVNMKLSFTLSMILPYVIQFFFIASITFQLYTQLLAEKNMPIRRMFGLLALLGGCGIAFAFNPIYDGDFNHTYREVSLKGSNETVFQKGLTMVAMPGCPHCYARLGEMRKLKEIYPHIEMHVRVINEDTVSVADYQNVAGNDIDVDFFPNSLIQTLQIQGFPTIYYKKISDTPTMFNWDNNGFGSAAWDYVIKQEKKK